MPEKSISDEIKSAPKPRCILAFDYGTQRIGVAVGQTITRTASPLSAIPAKDGVPRWETIAALIDEWRPQP